MLTNADITELVALRHKLHQQPELSGEEAQTAEEIAAQLSALGADEVVRNLGGHGVAGIFDSGLSGKTVLFRAELDALPITETSGVPWSSEVDGKGHLCGHDGHMTILLALGRLLARNRPKTGRCILMFQPAEEDGSGAKAVVADAQFKKISPDYAFAIHNEPGLPFGYVGIKDGLINCASRGLAISLYGRTSHAAEPELANSPIALMPEIIAMLEGLGHGGVLDDDFTLSTITHISAGEKTFGITPGDATIYVTLRAAQDTLIGQLQTQAETSLSAIAKKHNMTVSYEVFDDFAASLNDVEAVDIACQAMDKVGVAHGQDGVPMRASEDFGAFGWGAKAAMLCLGPGDAYTALHQPDYDFEDGLIPIGAKIFERIARDILD